MPHSLNPSVTVHGFKGSVVPFISFWAAGPGLPSIDGPLLNTNCQDMARVLVFSVFFRMNTGEGGNAGGLFDVASWCRLVL